MSEYLTQKEFAEQVGVARSVVGRAILKKRIVRTKKGINPKDPINQLFATKSRARFQKLKGKKLNGKNARSKTDSFLSDLGLAEKTPPQDEKPKEKKRPGRKPSSAVPFHNDDQERFDIGRAQVNLDLEKTKAQIASIKTKNAKEMKKLVDRELVKKAFGQMYSILVNFFLTHGDRMAPLLGGVFGNTEQEMIIKAKGMLDKDITRGLKEMKKIADSEWWEK